jgi:hypothetical protein
LRQLDRNLINERQFRGEDLADASPVKLAAAASLVKAEQIMVVMAALDYDGSKPVITITARLFDKNGQLLTDIFYGDQMILTNLDQEGLDENAPENHRQDGLKLAYGQSNRWCCRRLFNGFYAGFVGQGLGKAPNGLEVRWRWFKAMISCRLIQRGGQVVLRLVGSREALGNALAAHKLELVDDDGRLLIKAKLKNS